ncbi:divalent-cation tolerance protein CutA [Pelagibaculum spongiae]|nr:divalent-cation tolerance protein CutA [Pelagibaculum spongiae]
MTVKDPMIAFCSCPDIEIARRVSDQMVREKLAACVSLFPGIESIYQWQDEIEHAQEVMLMIKTTKANWKSLEKLILDKHPYELPELIAVDISNGIPDYLSWIEKHTQ